jgi:hypothetical protein
MIDPPPDDDLLAFTPVPLARSRHDGWTPLRQRLFIDRLAMIGLVSAAARSVRMSPKSAYALRNRAGAESFAKAWDAAVWLGLDTTRATAIDRAIHGVKQPVFYKGQQVGERTVYNDKLLLTALRRYYRERDGTVFGQDVA